MPPVARQLDDYHILQRAKELEAEHQDNADWLGFDWEDVPAHPTTLNRLVIEGLLKVSYSSRSRRCYRTKEGVDEQETPEQPLVAPINLFDIIVGCQDIKDIISKSIDAVRPVHVLLVGPPATAKTLFLSEISRLPNSRYAIGGTTSRAGIVDFLLESRPRILIVDEIDKMDMRDFSALLSVMETGIVTRLKRGMQESMEITCWVFAGANSIAKLPKELLSRFLVMHVPTYSEGQFQEVVRTVLTKRENVDPEIADYIAHKITGVSQDVRDAVHVARLASSVQEVDNILRTVWR